MYLQPLRAYWLKSHVILNYLCWSMQLLQPLNSHFDMQLVKNIW